MAKKTLKVSIRGIAVIGKRSGDLYGFYEDFTAKEVIELLEEDMGQNWDASFMLFNSDYLVLNKRLA